MRLLSAVMIGALSLAGACGAPRVGAAPAAPATPAAPAGSRELDRQIGDLADQLLAGLTFAHVDKVAVLDFPGLDGKVAPFGRYLAEELTTRLVRAGRFQVVERRLLNQLLAEQKLDASGLVDEATASRLGRVLGAGAIMTGTVADLDASVKINARVMETATSSVSSVATVRIPLDPELTALLGREPKAGPAGGSFDGEWEVLVGCPPQDGALGYHLHFTAQVKAGVLHGQYGSEGVPPCLTLDGKIRPDGSAVILANGLTGDARYNVKQYKKGLPVFYHIEGTFAGDRGTGHRLETRACDVTFSRM